MSKNTPSELIKILNAAGKTADFCKNSDGSGILILPYGGRVLGLYSPKSNKNFFWTNPALENVQSAKAFFQSDNWHNSGGHRTWLAPEVSFFYPNFPDLTNYYQPRQLENSDYQILSYGNKYIKLANRFALTSFQTKNQMELQITKSLSAAPNPLKYQLENIPDCEYAGYTISVKLEILCETISLDRIGLWDLVQMPHGGDILVPTYRKTVPRHYFGNILPDDLSINDHLVRYKMRNKGICKFGISPAVATGRAGYIYQTGDNEWNLIIRNFFVDPSGKYIDVPCSEINGRGDAVQVCSVNNEFGTFSELEYHTPAIGKQTGRNDCEDISQVWAFRGKYENIRNVADILLCKL